MQTECDHCQEPLEEGAAYCPKCHARTRRARSIIRLAVRYELLAVALVLVMIVVFTFTILNSPAAPTR